MTKYYKRNKTIDMNINRTIYNIGTRW